jgi:hypothetical protein
VNAQKEKIIPLIRTVEKKGEYARRKHRSPACVSMWIAEGKISPAALIGDGVRARIWVEQADADLVAALEPSQQFSREFAANTRSTLLPLSPAPASDDRDQATANPQATLGGASERERDMARRSKADADRAEHEAEGARRKLLVDEGRYVVAEAAAREWRHELSKLISEIETFLSATLAKKIAEKHGLDRKALTVEMREEFRVFRGGISEDARGRREAIEAEAVSAAAAEGTA